MTNEQPPSQPLTRRQLRELRSTGATPVVTPEAAPATPPSPQPAVVPDADPASTSGGYATASRDAAPPTIVPQDRGVPTAAEQVPLAPVTPVVEPVADPSRHAEEAAPPLRRARRRSGETDPVSVSSSNFPQSGAPFAPAGTAEHPLWQAAADLASPDATERGVVSPQLGATLLAGSPADHDDLPASFDQLLSRPAGGSSGTGNALIVSDSRPQGIIAPVNATGEVLVTGSLALPDLFAATGQMPGVEALDIDGTFADGELPQHSSPTPIAASAAISTVKTTAEIIKPPAPEKGSRLMLTLAITAGVLALALVGVLILAFVTGVFS